ncbi:hypothetical protein [Paenibacillus sp. L3-i20]|uniref:hypothetical protein n=1 Tax=Paenibacillus sp. L3-i20 TaxID=2905833 RepID=UPI001EDFDEE8|nr:hypothetical protein [Paenibacillus sp. L3-i20]GKU76447.1 hypothetical protein L3i20_v208440 [Paenibacillus sp. L3-i20]
MSDTRMTLVYAPNETARQFLRLLMSKGIPVAAVVNSGRQKRVLEGFGINNFVRLDTKATDCPLQQGWIEDVYLFDDSTPLTCRYLRLFRPLVTGRIIVVMQNGGIPGLYRYLGADRLFHATDHPSELVVAEEEKMKEEAGC